MSSSFVKDCSDASKSSGSGSNKTVIIIVNNDGGNGPIYGNDLQNILGTKCSCLIKRNYIKLFLNWLSNICNALDIKAYMLLVIYFQITLFY